MGKLIKKYIRKQSREIVGVVVATGPGEIGWSLIHPDERRLSFVKERVSDRKTVRKKVGIDPRDHSIAEKRSREKEIGAIPYCIMNHPYDRTVFYSILGDMYVRSMKYFK